MTDQGEALLPVQGEPNTGDIKVIPPTFERLMQERAAAREAYFDADDGVLAELHRKLGVDWAYLRELDERTS